MRTSTWCCTKKLPLKAKGRTLHSEMNPFKPNVAKISAHSFRAIVPFPAMLMSFTYTDTNRLADDYADDAQTSFSRLVLCPIQFPRELFRLSHSKQSKGVRTGSFLEEPQLLQYCDEILAMCVVVDVSTCRDIPILEFSIICEHLPIFTWV